MNTKYLDENPNHWCEGVRTCRCLSFAPIVPWARFYCLYVLPFPASRYSHSRRYLETVCRDAGFRVLASSDVILRKNAGVPVPGFVFVTEAVIPAPAPTS